MDLNYHNRFIPEIKDFVDSRSKMDNISTAVERGIDIAEEILKFSSSRLHFIKQATGEESQTYKEIAEYVAVGAGGCLKFEVGTIWSLSRIIKQMNPKDDDKSEVDSMIRKLDKAALLMNQITNLPMGYEERRLMNEVNVQLNEAKANLKYNKGCFVATYAFSGINKPEVQILRDYRDNKLLNFWWGKLFVKFYYAYSPSIVNFLERIRFSKPLIRFFLMKFIRFKKL